MSDPLRAEPDRGRRTSSSGGSTRLLILFAIAVALLVHRIFVPSVFRSGNSTSESTARNQMAAIVGAIDIFALENGRIPTTLEELTERFPKFGEPIMLRIPDDPWREAYRYRVIEASARRFQLRSAGEDRRFDTEDDVTFPEPDPK